MPKKAIKVKRIRGPYKKIKPKRWYVVSLVNTRRPRVIPHNFKTKEDAKKAILKYLWGDFVKFTYDLGATLIPWKFPIAHIYLIPLRNYPRHWDKSKIRKVIRENKLTKMGFERGKVGWGDIQREVGWGKWQYPPEIKTKKEKKNFRLKHKRAMVKAYLDKI